MWRYMHKAFYLKFITFLIIFLVPLACLGNDAIAGKICNAYTEKAEKEKCFHELRVEPKYIAFKYGGSACPDIKYWEKLIDDIENNVTPDMKEFDKNCYSLRARNIVYGFLNIIYYKSTELAQVKSSEGHLLWVETAGVKDIVSSQAQKPYAWLTILRNQDGKIMLNQYKPPKK
jgi:hypothetical protein